MSIELLKHCERKLNYHASEFRVLSEPAQNDLAVVRLMLSRLIDRADHAAKVKAKAAERRVKAAKKKVK